MFQEIHFTWGWFASLAMIMWINILLSGDNALVIAMACKNLAPRQRFIGIGLGGLGAIVARLVLLFAAASVLTYPGVKLLGGVALLWVAWNLAFSHDDDAGHPAHDTLLMAILTIVIADVTMSLDNVIAVAAAAAGDNNLLIGGMLLSIPIIIGGATLLSALLDRFPWLTYLGALLLVWIGLETMLDDKMVKPVFEGFVEFVSWL